ncbi:MULTISPECIES: SCO2322 family protein [unclassified Streptomyces]|uniref:SCO2322 family protein n=1 Tax=unclassified Streptomyces TaxID=2593676 RepID=UPI001907E962|nr:SCO2322 family protein [Streptomyces sp. HSG2]
MTRRVALPLLTALLSVCAVLVGAGQAGAAGYRYWSFWEHDGGAWVYATQGPSLARPDDGSVQGFRFAVSEDSSDAARPRGVSDFAAVCAGTPATDGTKRVALVLDFGTASDAPDGETPPEPRAACARVAPEATTADALAAVAGPLRYDSSALLCAIAGYPHKGCGEPVSVGGEQADSASGSGRETDDPAGDGGPSAGLLAGLAGVAALGGVAVWQARRRGPR